MNLIINVDTTQKEETLCLTVPKITPEIESLEKKLNAIIKEKEQLIGYDGNDIYIINTKDIYMIYSLDKNNYCKNKNGNFKLKEPLYILEEILPKNKFIRISNSTIININYIKCFNTSIIGKIIVKFNDNETAIVSKSRTKQIMEFLKERKNKND